MSWTTTFQSDYATQTASSSSTGGTGAQLVSTDTVLAFATGPTLQRAVPIGSISGLSAFQSISSSTTSGFVTITPYGTTFLTASATGAVAILGQPPQSGLYKTICLGTSTTTGFQVICQSTNVSILTTGGSSNAVVPATQILFGQQAAYVDLISVSTSAWMMVGKTVSATAVAFTTTTST